MYRVEIKILCNSESKTDITKNTLNTHKIKINSFFSFNISALHHWWSEGENKSTKALVLWWINNVWKTIKK